MEFLTVSVDILTDMEFIVLTNTISAHAILVGMISRNANSVGTRAVSAALYNICYQFGSIIAVNIYRNEDKPYCKIFI